MRIVLGLLSLSLVAVPALRCSPYDPNVIADNAQWALHLDVGRFQESKLGREVVKAALQQEFDTSGLPMNIDLEKLVAATGSLTAYGSSFSTAADQIDGVLVVQGKPELEKIALGYLVQATVTHPQEYREVKDLGMEAYSIGNTGITIAFPGRATLLVSKSREQLLKANAVLVGKMPNLAESKESPIGTLLRDTIAGPYFRVGTVVPNFPDEPQGAPMARILQMAKFAGASLGEQGTKTALRLNLVASSAEGADKLNKIVQGVAAMATLAETDDPDVDEVLKSIASHRSENSVIVETAAATERLVERVRLLVTESEPAAPKAVAP